MVQITFQPDNKTIMVPTGTTILAAARQAGVTIEAPCNGAGHCGKCVVRVDRPRGLVLHADYPLAGEDESVGLVLACHAEVTADLTVFVANRVEQGLQIITGGIDHDTRLHPHVSKRFAATSNVTEVYAGAELLTTEPGDTRAELLGAAIDIGTTTLVVSLVDLVSGRELISRSALNPQSIHAQDVLSRIRFAADDGGLRQMQEEVITALNRLLNEAAAALGQDVGTIYEAVLSGNTCMLHLAAGVDPAPLGKYPF
ncbi:MAG TPA: 2Fe-2S iron-sulfur cluster-binding protein, partial [Geobacteraceae bacterium]